jgi:RNA polymerase sigma factor (sigma-70 family)
MRTPEQNQQLLEEAYTRYAPVLLNRIFNALGDWERSEDLLHDSFLRAWDAIDRFDEQRGQINTWLTTIVINRISLELKTRSRMLYCDIEIHFASPEYRVDLIDVQAALATLPPLQQKQLMWAAHGYSCPEIVEMGGETYRMTWEHIKNFRKKLKKLVA